MEVGLIRTVDIDHEMQQAYLDYAMSVIVARALPDARDGLKPVHRRILYAMYDMGMRPDSPFKKSARIVGEVLGKYHPHGDMAVYEAMARMAQDFSMRYMLVDGQGNFGSVDGDPPAAMRYTEARLAPPAMNLLADIQKNTVNFLDNFDGTLSEPDVLPAALPNLLINGATGIAVGMSTSIPPHNLGEVVDALNYMLEHWEAIDDINVDDLMQFIKGPDFPTGGIIIQGTGEEEGITSAYGSGRGRVTVQARAHLEEMGRGRNRIIVSELPYMTNKASLIERIAELVREGKLDGLADLRDESDRHGLRIVIELTKSVEPEAVLQALYKSTPMRSTFGIIMLALVGGEPRMLSLKQALRVYLEHRLVVIRRRTEYDLERARQRAHILDGLRIALKNLDAVIELIRKSPDADTARERLVKRFRLSEIQAQAILDMPLRRLAALERKKIEEEYKELQVLIKDLEGKLRSPKKIRQEAAEEFSAVKEQFGDRRRTQILYLDGKTHEKISLLTADLAPDHTVWLAVSAGGLIWRTLDDNPPRQSGREAPRFLARVSTRDTLYLVSEQGDAAAVPVHSIPEAEDSAAGAVLWKVTTLTENDKLAAIFTLPPKEANPMEGYILTATRQGMLKKSALSELPGPSARTFPVVKVNEGDRLGWVRLTRGKEDVLLVSADGMSIRFSEEDVRPMGLVAAGVGGIKLQNRDELVGMELIPAKGEILLVAADGKAKRLQVDQFPVQGRYGQGVVAWKLPRTTSLVGSAAGKGTLRITLHLDKLASKVVRLDEAPLQTRAAQGKQLVELKAGDVITGLTVLQELAPAQSRSGSEREKNPAKSRPVDSDDDDRPAPKIVQMELAVDGLAPKEEKKPARVRKTAASVKESPAKTSKPPKPAAETIPGIIENPQKTSKPVTKSKPVPSEKPPQVKKTAETPAGVEKKTAGPSTSKSKAAAGKSTPPAKPTTRTAAVSKTPPVASPKPSAGKAAPKAKVDAGEKTKPKPAQKPGSKPAQSQKPSSRPGAATSTKKTPPKAKGKPTGKKPASGAPSRSKTGK